MLEQSDLLAIAQLIDERLKPINEQLKPINGQLEHLVEENRQTRVLVEHQDHSISLIAEQHGDIIARLPDVEEQDELKSRVRVLEHIVTDLRVEIDKLKKAQ